MMRVMRKGQSITEYAIVMLLVIAAVAAMQVYVKRRHQAMVKLVADTAVGGLLDAGVGFQTKPDGTIEQVVKPLAQYEPYYSKSDVTTDSTGHDNTHIDKGWKTNKDASMTDTRNGSQGTDGANSMPNDDAWTDAK